MSRQGRHGESLFSTLCQDPDAKTEAVVNKAGDDEHGWDHVVDLTPQTDASLPADLQDHLIQSFAQIKTTKGLRPATRVKLSNALKSAKSPNPSFIFLFHHDSENEAPTLYGKHIWRNEIEKFLMRGRKASVESQTKALYDVTLTISFSTEDQIKGHPSDWMLEKIKEQGGGNYAANKLNLVRSVGYGEFTHEVKLSIPTSASVKDIVLHELGLIKDLPVTDFTMLDKRFGMNTTVSKPQVGEGRLEVSSEGRPVLVKLISYDLSEFDISAKLKMSQMVPPDHEEFRFRIDAGCFDIIVHPKGEVQTIRFSMDLEEKGKLDQKIGLLTYLSWSSSGQTTFELHGEEGKFFTGLFDNSTNAKPWMDELSVVGRHIVDLLGPEKSKAIEVSFRDFERSAKDMYLASAISEAGSLRLQANFSKDLEGFSHLIGFAFTQVDNWCVGALYQIEHKARGHDDDMANLYFSYPRIVKSFAFKKAKGDFANFIKSEFNEFRRRFNTPTAVVMDGDLTEWSKAINENTAITMDIS
ncbi:hypothetical protein [Paracoccus sp. SCSIO 75233]|uniref:hypothetical protein n=1 Tax=Paracoccus sp. SCSIO 75233 TaxID=3017782 RepID=UPI0022EFF3CC|nr:hypothetical protein [Paracoccus sp. SCSIO 75233]WBU54388.1 hypothetical protein PAF12_06015 [Paracoccus sp. SCSIO 75233]